MADLRRSIPGVDALLSSDAFSALLRSWPRELVLGVLQRELAVLRSELQQASRSAVPDAAGMAARVQGAIERVTHGSLVPVINATGVILHTNLGRAPLARDALAAIVTAARGYSNLEYDRLTGARGSRYTHCRELLQLLTGAEDALVVNNNAAALVLALNTLAQGLEVIVSRGELVEIGGAFRVPEILARSGARLREVGATNRTHAADYRAAVGPHTGALLKVHPSNFTMSGYTAEVSVRELADIAAEAELPLVHDVGSGLLCAPAELGLPLEEPTPRASLDQGADIVTMSGDKLLGGPQCGILLGPSHHLERMRRNPLCRALRVDKLTLAALAATLRLHLQPERARSEIPVLRMLTAPAAEVQTRAAALAEQCTHAGLDACVVAGSSAVGGGASPDAVVQSALVLVSRAGVTASELERRLRTGRPPVVARIVDDQVALDIRTVDPEDERPLIDALVAAARA